MEANVPGCAGINSLESPHFPRIIWIIIAKSLGIKRYAGEKPIVALVLYIFTIASAFGKLL